MSLPKLVFIVGLVVPWLAPPHGAGQTRPAARDSLFWIERGQAELDRYFFHDAESALRKAIALDPESATAHRLLARALLGQLPPNLRLFQDTEGVLSKAEAEAKRAVELLPTDPKALCVLGIVESKVAIGAQDPLEKARRLNNAKDAFDRALAADPTSVEAHHELALLVIDHVMWPVLRARTEAGMSIGQKGPIPNASFRLLLRTRYQTSIENAISRLRPALEIKPAYAPAMKDMATLLLLRASLRDSEADYAADSKAAEEWQQRADGLAPKPALSSANLIPEGAKSGGVLGAIIGGVPSAGQQIVLTPEEAEKRLIKKAEPVYPPAAKRDRLQGDVLLMVTIGVNGHVESSRFASGPPLFLAAAQEAVSKWVYEPMIVDGQARKWTTSVQVRFVLP